MHLPVRLICVTDGALAYKCFTDLINVRATTVESPAEDRRPAETGGRRQGGTGEQGLLVGTRRLNATLTIRLTHYSPSAAS